MRQDGEQRRSSGVVIRAFWLSTVMSLLVWGAACGGEEEAPVPKGTPILSESFEDGTLDQAIFTPIGDAVLEQVNGQLIVRVTSTRSGVRINIPEGSHPRCLSIVQDIDQSRFPVGAVWRHTIEMVNIETGEEVGFQLSAHRTFWNRCEYKLTNKTTGETTSTRVLKPTKVDEEKHPCPNPKNIQFDWLPPMDLNDDGEENEVIQVEITDPTELAQQKEMGAIYMKESNIEHDGESPSAYRITAWEITAVENHGFT